MPDALGFGWTVPPLILPAATSSDESAIRYFVYPLMILLVTTILRLIAALIRFLRETRREHLEKVRLLEVMTAEIVHLRASYDAHCQAIVSAYADGAKDGFLFQAVTSDDGYYPYVVRSTFTLSTFGSDPHPTKTFAFMRSRVLIQLCKFHDAMLLLGDQLEDLREEAFIKLSPQRKMRVFETIVGLIAEVDAAYEPCLEALRHQHLFLTSRNWTWNLLFPFRARLAGLFEIVAIFERWTRRVWPRSNRRTRPTD